MFPKTGYNYISNKCKSCTSLYKKQNKDISNPFIIGECKQCDKKFKYRKKSKSSICRSCLSKNNTKKVRSVNTCKTCKENFEAIYAFTGFCSKLCYNTRSSKAQEYREWYSKNKEKRKSYHRNKYSNDINFQLSDVLRSRLRKALKNNAKSGSAVRDLGCSISELKKYLESQFQEGMSWDNYGRDGWHIDHIEPLAAFDLEDKEELKKACHYTNLQPLWAEDNLKKSNKKHESFNKL